MTTRRRSTREEQQTKEESPERVKENKGGHWFSTNPSKQWGEKFYLFYSIFWIGLFGAVVFFEFYKVLSLYPHEWSDTILYRFGRTLVIPP